jgi:hypothetical protein
VHRTVVEDEHTYTVRIGDGAMLDAAEHVEHARAHLTATKRDQLAPILACEPDKLDRELDTLTARAKTKALKIKITPETRERARTEGLSTVLVDSVAIGGQASTSARIENYPGFPAGISGTELTERAALQAKRFGADSAVPVKATGVGFDDGHHVVALEGGDHLRGRTVVVATGARYRRLAECCWCSLGQYWPRASVRIRGSSPCKSLSFRGTLSWPGSS